MECPKIKKSLQLLNEIATPYKEKITSISNDIKELELLLKEMTIPTGTSYCFNGFTLSWEKDSHQNKRILLNTGTLKKPLIEMDTETRFLVHAELPNFISALTSSLKVQSLIKEEGK